ncbi:MAG: hypothetical protein CM15mP108_2690 [Gammaproteobacteria bacterium]|nr:MAG: hypothetical protein CM15mP108_2690 [Gammaproteobacteria bacterium]
MKKFIPICISCSFLLVFPFLIAEEPDFYGKINVSYENAKKVLFKILDLKIMHQELV